MAGTEKILTVFILAILLSECPPTCAKPVTELLVKPGRCPMVPYVPLELCLILDLPMECSTDQDCSGPKKCCTAICGGKSCEPDDKHVHVHVDDNEVIPNSLCPALPDHLPSICASALVINECDRDCECDPDHMCCAGFCGARECIRKDFVTPSTSSPSTSPTMSPTMCPTIPDHMIYVCHLVSYLFPPATICDADFDCNEDVWCCLAGACGGRECFERHYTGFSASTPFIFPTTSPPTTSPPTTSPPTTSPPTCLVELSDPLPAFCAFFPIEIHSDICFNDEECFGNDICCPDLCGIRSCMDASLI